MATSTSPSRDERHPGGYTLLELLVVIVLVSGLAGLGLGMITRTGNDLERSATTLRDFARIARANARFHRAPARVLISPPPGTVITPAGEVLRNLEVLALAPVAEWNFESGRAGASRGLGGTLTGGYIDDGGRVGKGLFPDEDAQQHGVSLDVRTVPAFDLRDGFLVRCDLRLDVRRACTVLRLGESFELGVSTAGRLRGAVTIARETGQAGRRINLRGVRRIPLGTWVKVELGTDTQTAWLRLDFVPEASERAGGKCYRDPEGTLAISDGGSSVPGVIDTVEVFAFESLARAELPEFVDVTHGPATLHFDAEGMIDSRLHASLPAFRLVRDETEVIVDFELGGLAR